MADPVSLSSEPLALIEFAFHSSKSLYQAFGSIQNNARIVRELKDELGSLNEVLKSLEETVKQTENMLSSLKLPLLLCGEACQEFASVIAKCMSHSNGSKTSFRDWARLKYVGRDIAEFRNLIAGYKSTIIIALGDANIRTAIVTTDLLNEYQGMMKNTAADLEDLLQGIDERIKSKISQVPGTSAKVHQSENEEYNIKDEKESIEQCLRDVQATGLTLKSIPLREQSASVKLSGTTTAQADKRAAELSQHGEILGGQAPGKLTKELESIKQRLDIVEDVEIADNGTQIIASTLDDLITVKPVRAGASSRGLIGMMSDEQLRRAMENSSDIKLKSMSHVTNSGDIPTSVNALARVTEEMTIKGIENIEVDSGYYSLENSEQTIKEKTNSESGSVPSVRLQYPDSVGGIPNANSSDKELRLSRKIIDLDETQRVTPSDEDIGSCKATVRIPEVITAETHLKACLSENNQVLTMLRQILRDNNVNEFREDVRELLKYFHLDLKAEARTNLESASADLLRGHWYRERIANRIARRFTGQAEEDVDEAEGEELRATEKSLFDLDQWLRNNQGFSDPNESNDPPLQDIVIDGHTSDDDRDESDSELHQAFQEPDYVKSMEHFIFGGTSFQKLLERIQMQAITPRYYALRRILMTLPTEDIEFHFDVRQTWFDQLRCGIERRSTVKWDWWPLQEPQERLECQQCRIAWTCHCGRKHETDLHEAEAIKLQRLIVLRSSPFPRDHPCFGRQKGRRSWRQFLQLINSNSSPKTPKNGTSSALLMQNQNVSCQPSHTTASGRACEPHSTNSSGSPLQNKPSNSSKYSTLNTNQLSSLQQTHSVPVGQGDDLRLVLGVKGKRSCLDVDQVDLNKQASMVDGELVRELMTAHKFKRGWLRLWFSVYQLRYFAFKKFLKYRRNRISSVEYGIPEGNFDYEYKNGSQTPPNERPPILQAEFEDSLYPCATPCFYWFWPMHECIGSLTEHRFYDRMPKKKSLWALDSVGASEAWGLESGYKVSYVHITAYHFVLVGGTFAFWGWWQAKFPHDVQGAAVPVTVVLALLSIFWTSLGLLKFPGEETF